MIRVLVADDHHLVRQGICALLARAPDIAIVGEAADGVTAVQLAGQLAPDVLLMDVAMPRLNGTLAAERLRSLDAGPRVIMLSQYSDAAVVHRALENGASGYLIKDCLAQDLLQAIRTVCRGEMYLSPALSRDLGQDGLHPPFGDRPAPPGQEPTPREQEVLQLIGEGHTNAAIAHTLDISIKTVEKHRASLMAKLDVHDLPGLMRVALRRRLLFPDA